MRQEGDCENYNYITRSSKTDSKNNAIRFRKTT